MYCSSSVCSLNCECIMIQKPVEITLGSHWVTSTSSKTSGQLKMKDNKFVYVPMIETLQQLMNNESVLSEV